MLDLVALHDIPLNPDRIKRIVVQVLLPLQQQPQLFSQYGDHIIQAQQQLLAQRIAKHGAQLSQILENILGQLAQAKIMIQPRRYPKWQSWLGLDIEQQARHDEIFFRLERDVKSAASLNKHLEHEHQSHLTQLAQLHDLRIEMAYYIRAAEQLLTDFDTLRVEFKARVEQKINTLLTAQTATDLAMVQLKLSDDVNLTLMDRFTETITILIPAWQQHVAHQAHSETPEQLESLNQARHRLLQTLTQVCESNF